MTELDKINTRRLFDVVSKSIEDALIESFEERELTIQEVSDTINSLLNSLKDHDVIYNYEFVGDELYVWPVKAEEFINLKVTITQGNG